MGDEPNIARSNGWAHLDAIQGDSLLGQFLEMGRDVIPVMPTQAKVLFTMYSGDGLDVLPLQEFEGVLRALCFPEEKQSSPAFAGALTRSVLVASFTLRSYEIAKNHYAQIQGWTLLGMGIARHAYGQGRELDGRARDVLSLVLDKLEEFASDLKCELLDRSDMLEGDWRGDGGDVYRARLTLVLGAVAAGELIGASRCNREADVRFKASLLALSPRAWIWSEGAIPFAIVMIKCLELLGEHDTAKEFLEALVASLVRANRVGGTKDIPALPSPYSGAEDMLLDQYDVDPSKEKLDRSEFVGSSWLLHSLVLMCAKRGLRQQLGALWPDISRMQCMAFEPDDGKSFCEVLTESGVNRRGFLPVEQSWASLMEQATTPTQSKQLWPLWGPGLLWVLLLCPYRWRAEYGVLIDGLGVSPTLTS